MNNFSVLLIRIISLAICLFLLIACGDSDENPMMEITDPVITDVGTPTGETTSMSIGATGGVLESADGNLTLIIPAGALQSATTITIQPITNEGPLGVGSGYRLQPEGTIFSKPVKLEFHYGTELLEGASPDFLWIITQSGDGSWNALLKSVVDTESMTVSAETHHFSDWALGRFIDLSLSPAASTVLKGKSIELRVAGFSRDKQMPEDEDLAPLIPLTGDTEVLTPLTPIPPIESRLMDFRIKRWTLNGTAAPVSNSNGSLSALKNSATYTAPNQKPTVNPVAVSVEMEGDNKEGRKVSYMLTSNISVVNTDLYLILKVDGKTYEYYQYGFNGTIPPDPNTLSIVNCGFSENKMTIAATTVEGGVDLIDLFGLELNNPTQGTRSLECFYTDGNDDVAFMPNGGEAYDDGRLIRTKSGERCETEYVCSDFTFTLTSFENEFMGDVRGHFSGTLYQDKPGYHDECRNADAHSIEGEFSLKLAK